MDTSADGLILVLFLIAIYVFIRGLKTLAKRWFGFVAEHREAAGFDSQAQEAPASSEPLRERANARKSTRAIKSIVNFTQQITFDRPKLISRMQSDGAEVEEDFSTAELISLDLACLVAKIVLPNDTVCDLDGLLLREYAESFEVPGCESEDQMWFSAGIYLAPEEDGFCFLKALREQKKEEFEALTLIYLEVGAFVATEGGDTNRRRPAWRTVERDLNQLIGREISESFDKHEPCSTPQSDDYRLRLMGLTALGTKKELRAAYHRMVGLWHPDRLSNVAPELQTLANERLARINEAYESLSADCKDQPTMKY